MAQNNKFPSSNGEFFLTNYQRATTAQFRRFWRVMAYPRYEDFALEFHNSNSISLGIVVVALARE